MILYLLSFQVLLISFQIPVQIQISDFIYHAICHIHQNFKGIVCPQLPPLVRASFTAATSAAACSAKSAGGISTAFSSGSAGSSGTRSAGRSLALQLQLVLQMEYQQHSHPAPPAPPVHASAGRSSGHFSCSLFCRWNINSLLIRLRRLLRYTPSW